MTNFILWGSSFQNEAQLFPLHIAKFLKLAIKISEYSWQLQKCKNSFLCCQYMITPYWIMFQETKGLLKTKTQIYKNLVIL